MCHVLIRTLEFGKRKKKLKLKICFCLLVYGEIDTEKCR